MHKTEVTDILGDPEVTANIYCKSRNLTQYEYAKLQYRFAVTSGSPSIYKFNISAIWPNKSVKKENKRRNLRRRFLETDGLGAL